MRLTCRILRFINASEPLAVKYSNDAPTMPQNSIPTPKGFLISTTSARIKESARKDDLAWLTSEKLCTGAAVFTRNAFPAAPVQVSRTVLNTSNGLGIFGVILNSGNANAVTGNQGLLDAWNMAEMADSMYRKRFNIKLTSKKHKSLVLSTGVIGVPMPIGNIKAKLDELTDNLRGDGEGWMRLAKAMMTTDTKPKLITEELEIEGVKYVLCGVAKGSGMIHPNMATLLSIMASDISLTANATKTVLEKSVESSFNCITVDGDTSTNDTAILLSNGAADGPTFDVTSEYFPQIQSAFSKLSKNLAELIVKDGEGATKFLRIKCERVRSKEEAKKVSMQIAKSLLFKTAMYGQDANWGRILCAVGNSGVDFNTEKLSVKMIDPILRKSLILVNCGVPTKLDEERASGILKSREIDIVVELNTGLDYAEVLTCDLSHRYVDINATYRT